MNAIAKITSEDKALYNKYRSVLQVNHDLTRQLVSFQANKKAREYRWYKYKEGFSSVLVDYILRSLSISKGSLLDPFAGSGAAVFTAAERGLKATGIELLPIGIEIMKVRKLLTTIDKGKICLSLKQIVQNKPWLTHTASLPFLHIRITQGAFPANTEHELNRYLSWSNSVKDSLCREILRFAALCILEQLSFTRKDGQYLRWDYRSGRRQGKKKFDKGKICLFEPSIADKLNDIINDLSPEEGLFNVVEQNRNAGDICILEGSVLHLLPKLKTSAFNIIITSPPYCNRYDYTRTYALELASLGIDEDKIRFLRQTMLSCTVENKDKQDLNASFSQSVIDKAEKAFKNQILLQLILSYLQECKDKNLLNNNGIVRMIRNYFYELSLIIFECARILKPNAPLVMVNDNVRYAGVPIPVDLILSDIAAEAGFNVDKIWVLPKGKGNSSQQMGSHGREELRKCVYVWRAPIKK